MRGLAPFALSQKFLELLPTELAVTKDFREQSGTDVFPRIHRDYRSAAVGVPKKMVTALDAENIEPRSPQNSYELLAGKTRQRGHAAIDIR